MADQPNPAAQNGGTANPPVIPSTVYVRDLENEHGGNVRSALRKAGKDNMKLRRRLAAVSQELDGYKTRNPQGSIVLVGDDVTAWNELKPVVTEAKTRNVKLGDIPKVFKERDDLAAKITTGETKSAARKAGEALGLKGDGLEAFEDLVQTKQVILEEKEASVVKEGKIVKANKWHAKLAADEKGSPVLVEDFKPIKPYLKALRAASIEDGDNGTTPDEESAGSDSDEGQEAEEVRTEVPSQRSSGGSGPRGGKPKDLGGKYMKSHYPLPSETAKKDKE